MEIEGMKMEMLEQPPVEVKPPEPPLELIPPPTPAPMPDRVKDPSNKCMRFMRAERVKARRAEQVKTPPVLKRAARVERDKEIRRLQREAITATVMKILDEQHEVLLTHIRILQNKVGRLEHRAGLDF